MNFEIVAPSSYLSVADPVAQHLGISVVVPHIHRFADGELEISFNPDLNFHGKKIYVLLSTYPPVHEAIIEFALIVHQVKILGAQEIIGVIPYFGYARHDKKQGGLPMIAKMIEATGIKKLISCEFHSLQAIKHFSIPVINVSATELIINHIKEHVKINNDFYIIAPDQGAHERCLHIAEKLGLNHISFIKERYAHDATKIISKNYASSGAQAIIIDDMIDTGGTALNVVNQLEKDGFKNIFGYFIHPVLSGNAQKRIEESAFEKIFVSSSIPLKKESKKIEIVDVSALLADAIRACISS